MATVAPSAFFCKCTVRSGVDVENGPLGVEALGGGGVTAVSVGWSMVAEWPKSPTQLVLSTDGSVLQQV